MNKRPVHDLAAAALALLVSEGTPPHPPFPDPLPQQAASQERQEASAGDVIEHLVRTYQQRYPEGPPDDHEIGWSTERVEDLHGHDLVTQKSAGWCVNCQRDLPFFVDIVSWLQPHGVELLVYNGDEMDPEGKKMFGELATNNMFPEYSVFQWIGKEWKRVGENIPLDALEDTVPSLLGVDTYPLLDKPPFYVDLDTKTLAAGFFVPQDSMEVLRQIKKNPDRVSIVPVPGTVRWAARITYNVADEEQRQNAFDSGKTAPPNTQLVARQALRHLDRVEIREHIMHTVEDPEGGIAIDFDDYPVFEKALNYLLRPDIYSQIESLVTDPNEYPLDIGKALEEGRLVDHILERDSEKHWIVTKGSRDILNLRFLMEHLPSADPEVRELKKAIDEAVATLYAPHIPEQWRDLVHEYVHNGVSREEFVVPLREELEEFLGEVDAPEDAGFELYVDRLRQSRDGLEALKTRIEDNGIVYGLKTSTDRAEGYDVFVFVGIEGYRIESLERVVKFYEGVRKQHDSENIGLGVGHLPSRIAGMFYPMDVFEEAGFAGITGPSGYNGALIVLERGDVVYAGSFFQSEHRKDALSFLEPASQ